MAVKDPTPKNSFQALQLKAHGGLQTVQSFRSIGHAAGIRDGDEGTDQLAVQSILSFSQRLKLIVFSSYIDLARLVSKDHWRRRSAQGCPSRSVDLT
ncbi:MAG: hypothetical protein AAFU49_12980 [Pseudomonadota bacterium]